MAKRSLDSAPSADGESRLHVVWTALGVMLFLLFAFVVLRSVLGAGDFPLDFVVFHGAGTLFAQGDSATAYDFEAFQAFLSQTYGRPSSDGPSLAHFLNPPPFGWFAQILSLLPLGPSFIAWGAAGVVASVASYRWLGLPIKALPLLIISPMMVFNLSIGQTGAAVLLITVAVHHLLIRDQRVLAGAVAGLFLLKPPLALGLGLLWLVKARKFGVAIAVSLLTGLVISLPTLVNGLDPWRDFLATSAERTELDNAISAKSSFSLAEFVKPVVDATVLVWIVGILLGLLFLTAVDRRHDGDIELLSGAAALVTVLFSPHILIYDSLILLIPVAVAYRRGALDATRVGMLIAIVGVGATTRLLIGGPSLEFPAALLAAAILAVWVDQSVRGSSSDEGELVVPVGADAAAVDGEREDLVVGE